MKLSTKGRYAVMAMSDLAVQARLTPNGLFAGRNWRARRHSLSYLEQLLRACAVPVW